MTVPETGGEQAAPRWTGDQWLLFVLCYVSLQAYSLDIGGIGVSANYVFVFIPLIMAMVGSVRPMVIRWELVWALLFFLMVYLAGLRFDVAAMDNGPESAFRRLASFVVFLLPFSLGFCRFRPGDMDVFKLAIVASAVRYSLQSIATAASLLASTPVDQLKALVGSQRYGFVLCLALFIVLFADRLVFRRALQAQRFVLAALILSGIAFTFTRATIVACLGGAIVAALVAGWRAIARTAINRQGQRTRRYRTLGALATIAIILVIVVAAQPEASRTIWGFYFERLIQQTLDSTFADRVAEASVGTSEGYRAYMWITVMEYIAAHPLMGSGFQGVYLMFDELKGAHSAHSQYLDVLARTGLLGFAVWLTFVLKIAWWSRRDLALLAGVASVLVYGLFHETFKLSQGGFLFGMLLSFSYLPPPDRVHPAPPPGA